MNDLGIKAIIGSIILFVILAMVDVLTSTQTYGSGIVIEKAFSPEETHVGIGTGISTTGNPVVVTSVSHKNDQYFVFVQTFDGSIKAETTLKRYLEIKKDDEVQLEYYEGSLTGMRLKVVLK